MEGTDKQKRHIVTSPGRRLIKLENGWESTECPLCYASVRAEALLISGQKVTLRDFAAGQWLGGWETGRLTWGTRC